MHTHAHTHTHTRLLHLTCICSYVCMYVYIYIYTLMFCNYLLRVPLCANVCMTYASVICTHCTHLCARLWDYFGQSASMSLFQSMKYAWNWTLTWRGVHAVDHPSLAWLWHTGKSKNCPGENQHPFCTVNVRLVVRHLILCRLCGFSEVQKVVLNGQKLPHT